MFRRTISAVATLALSLLFAGCGEEIQGDVELRPATEFPFWMYEEIGPLGITLARQGIHGMGFGGPVLQATAGGGRPTAGLLLAERLAGLPSGALANRLISSPSCLPDLFGDGVDTDADGIPDDRTATYTAANCTVYDTATGDAYLVRGRYRIRDTNDDRYGFRLDVTDLSVRIWEGQENDGQSLLYNITETSHLNSTGGSYRLLVDAVGSQAEYTGDPSARHLRYDLTQSFTPAFAIPVGGPLPDGTMTFSGNIDVAIAGHSGTGRVKLTILTTQPFIYDDGCGGITSGALEMRLNNGPTEGVHVVFSACNGYYEPIGAGVL